MLSSLFVEYIFLLIEIRYSIIEYNFLLKEIRDLIQTQSSFTLIVLIIKRTVSSVFGAFSKQQQGALKVCHPAYSLLCPAFSVMQDVTKGSTSTAFTALSSPLVFPFSQTLVDC